MEENKENTENENLKDKAEHLKDTVGEKAEEFAKTAKDKAESFAGKTIDAAEKLINDVFKKNKPEDTEFEEEVLDPKDLEIAALKKEAEEQKDKYLRLYADFDNFKKRTAKEKIELIQTAGKDVIKDMLAVVDDFERALKASGSTDANDGVRLIYNKFVKTLADKGVKAMETVGTEFNPDLHEAITEIPVAGMEGKVIDEVEKGYYLNDKIIRYAKVVVGKTAE
ncbi:MAG: nucleotide exchange factor GrpE [Bacteroidetes bacterium]|nr:nucleotide exchange factor GrpE [Bacteroidota bacterium]